MFSPPHLTDTPHVRGSIMTLWQNTAILTKRNWTPLDSPPFYYRDYDDYFRKNIPLNIYSFFKRNSASGPYKPVCFRPSA